MTPPQTLGSASVEALWVHDFESTAVELSLMAVYLAIRSLGDEDPELSTLLRKSLEGRARQGDRVDLIRQALSGMPEAIVPFKRDRLDIFLAAGLMKEASRAGLRGEGNAVDAGYFSCATGEVRYVDTVSRVHQFHSELVDPDATKALLSSLQSWTTPPRVQVGDPAEGEILRLLPGTDEFPHMGIEPPQSVRLAERGMRAQISLLRVGPPDPNSRQAPDPQVTRVAYGQAAFEREGFCLVLRDVQTEFLMELQAACLTAQEEGVTLWLSIDRARNDFLAPLPDLMQPGACSVGWWAPISDISSALGGAHGTSVRVPRWAALRLMQRLHWAWTCSREDWVLGAWWLQRQGPGAVFGPAREAPARQQSPDFEIRATDSPLSRLGSFLGRNLMGINR